MKPPVAITGTNSDRNTTTMISSDRPTTSAEVERQGVRQLLRDVDVAAGLAGHGDLDATVERRGCAEVLDELLRGDARRALGRDDLEGDAWPPSVDVPIGATATTSVNAASCRPMRTCRRGPRPGSGTREVRDDEERAVHARAELLGDGRVRVVLGRVTATPTSRRAGRGASTAPERPAARGGRRRAGRDRSPAWSTSVGRAARPAGPVCARERGALTCREARARRSRLSIAGVKVRAIKDGDRDAGRADRCPSRPGRGCR